MYLQPENFSRHCGSPAPSLDGSSRPHRRHPSPPSIGSANGQRLRLIPSPPHPYVRRRGPPTGTPFYHRLSHHGIEGVSLASVRRSDEFMDHPNIPIILGGRLRSKISYHFMIKGWPVFSKQQHAVRVKNGRRVPKLLRDVARQVVALFYIFLSEHQDDPSKGADKVVFGPGGIAVEDLYLYELMQINTASVEVRLGYKPSQRPGVTRNSSAQPSALPGVAAPELRNAVTSSSALWGRWQVNCTGAAIPTSAGRSALHTHPTHSYPILAHANPVAGDTVYPMHRHALEAAGSSPSAYEDMSSMQPSQHHGTERRDSASSLETASYDCINPRASNTTPAQTLPTGSDFPAPIASPPRLVRSLAGDSFPPSVCPTDVPYPEEAGFTSGEPAFAPASWPLSDQAAQYDSLEAAWPFASFHPSLGPPLPPLDNNVLRGTPQIALPLFEPRTFLIQ